MTEPEPDLLAVVRGSVSAPAGCGKTELIARAIVRQGGDKPILVLTHTNAGVVALRQRLDRMGVRPSVYRLSTIDGWAMRLIATFPARSGHDPAILKLSNPGQDYPAIRCAALRLLQARHLDSVLACTYARLIVDEYQDCSVPQHGLVCEAARVLPTCVLGDPLQAIFGFNEALAGWDEVCATFPLQGELSIPWRWHRVDAYDLGAWLLDVRRLLLASHPIDLRNAPSRVTWIHLDGTDDHARRLRACRTSSDHPDGGVLIIGDMRPASHRSFASRTPGAVTVESVDLRDVVTFARGFDVAGRDVLERLVGFADEVMTGLGGAELVKRVHIHRRGTARVPPTEAELATLAFLRAPTNAGAAELLATLNRQTGVRVHRPTILRGVIRALQTSGSGSLHDAALRVREENRLLGRPLPKRAVSSTLLLKGLEADVAVILDASALSRANLYVAMTRGCCKLVICSKTPVLQPA